jgi:hypothetical protein
MPVPTLTTTQRARRRSRYLIPIQTPRRDELVAALATAAVLVHVLFAQLTLVLVIAFHATSRVSRWRPQWLAAPAAAGLVWALAIGPAAAAARLVAGPRRVLAYFAGTGQHPGRILHPAGAFAGLTHWLPGQFPLALVLAAAEAGGLWWLAWLHSDERMAGQTRPGLIVALRRRWTAASIRSGGVVTRDGGCVGIDAATGRPAAISWQEAEGGVLCTGPAGLTGSAGLAGGPGAGSRAGPDTWPGSSAAAEPGGTGIAETCFMLAHAAIRRRKPVIVIDLTGSGWLAQSLAGAGTAAGAPLRHFGAAGPGCYEPVRGGDPAQAASLVTGMIDWTGTADQHRRTCAAYLTDAFAVLAAAPADRRVPALDDLTSLLNPAALRARLDRVPSYHPRKSALADRVAVSVRQAAADPAALSAAADQLRGVRASVLGHWLGPEPPWRAAAASPVVPAGLSSPASLAAGSARISLGQAVRDRAVVAFSLDLAVHGQSACMIASLAACDLMAVCAELDRIGVSGDAVAWIHGCEAMDDRVLTELVSCGAAAGLAVLLSTASAAAAERLAEAVNVVLARGPAGPALTARFAELAWPATGPGPAGGSGGGPGLAPDHPLDPAHGSQVGAQSLPTAGSGQFALLVKGPRRRVLPLCRSVRAAGTGGRR